MTAKSDIVLKIMFEKMNDTEHINRINYVIGKQGYPSYSARRTFIAWLHQQGYIEQTEQFGIWKLNKDNIRKELERKGIFGNDDYGDL